MDRKTEQFVDSFQTFVESNLLLPYKQPLSSLIDLAGYKLKTAVRPDNLLEFLRDNQDALKTTFKSVQQDKTLSELYLTRLSNGRMLSKKSGHTTDDGQSGTITAYAFNFVHSETSNSDSESISYYEEKERIRFEAKSPQFRYNTITPMQSNNSDTGPYRIPKSRRKFSNLSKNEAINVCNLNDLKNNGLQEDDRIKRKGCHSNKSLVKFIDADIKSTTVKNYKPRQHLVNKTQASKLSHFSIASRKEIIEKDLR